MPFTIVNSFTLDVTCHDKYACVLRYYIDYDRKKSFTDKAPEIKCQCCKHFSGVSYNCNKKPNTEPGLRQTDIHLCVFLTITAYLLTVVIYDHELVRSVTSIYKFTLVIFTVDLLKRLEGSPLRRRDKSVGNVNFLQKMRSIKKTFFAVNTGLL